MPVLNYGRPDNWVLISSLSKGEIFVFRQYIYDAKKTFKYKEDRDFLKTLEPNIKYEKPFIYSFDSSINKVDDPTYILKMQALLEEANKYMEKADKKFKGYKLDIMGTWNTGYIVVMKHTKLADDPLMQVSKRALRKRYQDAH